MTVTVGPIPRDEIDAALADVARLRISVFRAFPYLYDGDPAYEERYLAAYRESPDAVIVGARDGDRLIGAATGAPMEDHAAEFGAAFAETDLDPRDVFYCAESVLLSAYRGRGIGHAFFDHREDRARALGRRYCCFCSVIRPATHPARPAGYASLEPFWRKRGYEPIDGVIARFAWRDIGDTAETQKPLQFWLRKL